jgi:hypothetical protein
VQITILNRLNQIFVMGHRQRFQRGNFARKGNIFFAKSHRLSFHSSRFTTALRRDRRPTRLS